MKIPSKVFAYVDFVYADLGCIKWVVTVLLIFFLQQQMHAQQLPHAAHAPPIPMMPHPGIAPPPGTASLLGLSALGGPGGHSLSMLTSKPELHRDDKSSSGKFR